MKGFARVILTCTLAFTSACLPGSRPSATNTSAPTTAAQSGPLAAPSSEAIQPEASAPSPGQPAEPGKVIESTDMLVDRAAHSATLLPTGQVLIAGGFNASEAALSSAEVFDPAMNQFLPTEPMTSPRQSHTATLLRNGKVLIAGGYDRAGNYLRTAEIYDPVTSAFTPAAEMNVPRAGHIAVLLDNGDVLLAGGVTTGWVFLESAELYHPQENSFAVTGSMATARESHTATVLLDGRVLITGGHQGRRAAIQIYSSAELYEPSNGTFSAAANMQVKRHKHDAVLLEDGQVLILGGANEQDDGGQYNSAEMFDPAQNTFRMIGKMSFTRYKFQGTSVLLKGGMVLIMGGASVTEIFYPQTNRFVELAGGPGSARLFATATPLQDGRVLLTGGYSSGVSISGNTWLYQP